MFPVEQMKPYDPTALEIWMKRQGFTDASLARRLLREGVAVRPSQIARWRRRGGPMPRLAALRALAALSEGEVTAAAFVGDRSDG